MCMQGEKQPDDKMKKGGGCYVFQIYFRRG